MIRFWQSLLGPLRTPVQPHRKKVLVGEPFFWLLGQRPRGRPAQANWRRILVVRLDEIGDVLLCTPFLRELRRSFPDAWITLVVKPGVRSLVEFCPHVNEVLAFDRRTAGRALRFAARHLWRRRFELAINPRRDIDWYNANLLSYLSGAPWRVGYAVAAGGVGGSGRDQLLTTAIENNPAQHEVNHDLDLLRRTGGVVTDDSLEVWVTKSDELAADRLLGSRGVQSGEMPIALAPGAGWPARIWPVENFLELAQRMRVAGTRTVVVGGPDAVPMGRLMASLGDAVVDLSGVTTLRQTAAVLSRCRLFVGNDSGPMHLAAAVGVPVVEVSSFPRTGPREHVNSPHRFGPWGVPAVVLQPDRPLPPCVDRCQASTAHCISQIEVDEVYAAVRGLLDRNSGRQSHGTLAEVAPRTPCS
jgi:ADP-heptose:LPS heptosyltransferase